METMKRILLVTALLALVGCAGQAQATGYKCVACRLGNGPEVSDAQLTDLLQMDGQACEGEMAQLAYMAPQRMPVQPYYSEPNSPTAAGFNALLTMGVNPPPTQAMYDGCMAAKGWKRMY